MSRLWLSPQESGTALCWAQQLCLGAQGAAVQARDYLGYFSWLGSQGTAAALRLCLCLLPEERENRTGLWKQKSFLSWMWSKNPRGIIQSPDQDLILHSAGRNVPLHKSAELQQRCSSGEGSPRLSQQLLSVPAGEQVTPGLAGSQALQEGQSSTCCTLTPAGTSQHAGGSLGTFCLRAKPAKLRKGFKPQQVEASREGALAQCRLAQREVAATCETQKWHFFLFFYYYYR